MAVIDMDARPNENVRSPSTRRANFANHVQHFGWPFPTIPSFVLEDAVVILVHKHNAGERYGFRTCKFQSGKSASWEEQETEEEPVQR
eukprot:3291435-Karenia_brevis.AAC.1